MGLRGKGMCPSYSARGERIPCTESFLKRVVNVVKQVSFDKIPTYVLVKCEILPIF